MSTDVIRSIEDLLRVLERDNSEYHGDVWYRGQVNYDWSLLPGYYRANISVSEATLQKRFMQNAAMLLDSRPVSNFDWMFLMQHYGVPTRLLDWSESPLVALYFAVSHDEENNDKDAALWSLRPSKLNEMANVTDKDEPFYIPSFDEDYLENYLNENFTARTELKPVAALATRNNSRIQAQHGVFTIHHKIKQPIDVSENESIYRKYSIPADSKSNIVKQLNLLCFNRFQLFPELESIGFHVKGRMV